MDDLLNPLAIFGYFLIVVATHPLPMLIAAVALVVLLATVSYDLHQRGVKRRWLVLCWIGGFLLLPLGPLLLGMLPESDPPSGTNSAGDRYGRASNAELLYEKHGRVVDATTGAGIAGVTVIATWHSSGFGWSGGGGGCDLAKVATTDTNGDYVITDISKELDISRRRPERMFPSLSLDSSWLDYSWRLVVYAPGYLRKGDAEDFQARPLSSEPTPNPGDPHHMLAPIQTVYFAWQISLPRVTSVGKVVEVAPIQLIPTKLDPSHEIVYYERVLRAMNNCGRVYSARGSAYSPPEIAAIQQDMQQRIRDLPCSLPPTAIIESNVVDEYMYLFVNFPLTTQRTLERAGLTNKYGPPWHKATTAGLLCNAVTEENEARFNTRPPIGTRQLTTRTYGSVRPQDATGSWAFLPYATISGAGKGATNVDVPMSPLAMVSPLGYRGGLSNGANTPASWPFSGSSRGIGPRPAMNGRSAHARNHDRD